MKIGDVIMLKSGSPEMTIFQIDEDIISSIYFDVTACGFKQCQLNEQLLKIVSSDEEFVKTEEELTEGNF